jgi:hypothetical protein
MLIYGEKHPKWGTNKPRQWGPLSAVRSAVFRNAESMGIDPASFIGFWPAWEGAGLVKDIISANDMSFFGNAYWENTGARTLGGTSDAIYANNNNNMSVGAGDFSVIVHCNIHSNSSSTERGIFTKYNIGGSTIPNWVLAIFSDYNYRFRIRDEANNSADCATATSSVVLGDQVLCGSRDGSTAKLFYAEDGYTSATNASVGSIDNTSPLSLGRFYTTASTDITFHQALYLKEKISRDQYRQLFGSPYILLQPNPTPLIFDWGTASTVPTLSAPSFVGRIPSTTLAF